jgi:chromosome segregation ATPase
VSSETLATLLAVLLSAANLLIAYGRNRARREAADTQALAVAVQMARRVPGLEQQLGRAAIQLQAARAEALENKHKIQELRQIIDLQAEAIRRLRQEKEELAAQLNDLRTTVQSLGGDYKTKGKQE